ncbi:MAG: T9SS type A sorting domain-containing protein [bacterium]|nr:T9SS type A sorting domain-containing protein [bacterium]
MKKQLLLLVAILSLSSASKGQFQYFYNWSTMSPSYRLSNGISTSYTTGFVWFGYESALQPGMYPWSLVAQNFVISGATANLQWMSYKVYQSDYATCTGTLSQVMNGYGVTGIESVSNSNTRFAVAGAYDKGCYFAAISPLGMPTASRLYRFPPASSLGLPAATKPLIVEDVMTGDYFIVGGVNGELYALRVDFNGNIIWSSYYKHTANLFPKDIVVSPFGDGKLIIVGNMESTPGNTDGLYMELNGNNGTVMQMKNLGDPLMPDEFTSVVAASAAPGGNVPGFVMAGSTQKPGGTIDPWIVRLDMASNTVWSTRLKPNSGTNSGFVDILERQNTYNAYEFYGVIRSNAGMVVLKLDASGQPFPITTTVVSNEFVFNLASTNPTIPAVPASISMVNGSIGNPQVGIQVYGNVSNVPGWNSSLMFSAYFNGENCARTLLVQDPSEQGPLENEIESVYQYGGMNACTNFTVFPIYQGFAINYPCSGLIAAGNNERQSGYTDIHKIESAQSTLHVYPNPVYNKLTVNYTALENDPIIIKVTNLLGQQIVALNLIAQTSGDHSSEIDLSTLPIESGVYFVSAIVNGESHEQKIVYSK